VRNCLILFSPSVILPCGKMPPPSSDGGHNYILLETTSSVSPPMYDCTLYLYSGDPPSPTGEGLCLHHPSPSAPPTPVSLRLGHGSALTVHRTVIHSLAAASLPGGRGFGVRRFATPSGGGLIGARRRFAARRERLGACRFDMSAVIRKRGDYGPKR